MFQGSYHGKPRHESDLAAVLERGRAAGVEKIMLTAGTLEEAKSSLEMVHCIRHTGSGAHSYTAPFKVLVFLRFEAFVLRRRKFNSPPDLFVVLTSAASHSINNYACSFAVYELSLPP